MAQSIAQQRQNLLDRRSAITEELAALSTSKAGGLPNATGPGVNVDHQGYKKGLYEELKEINSMLASLDVGIVESEGY